MKNSKVSTADEINGRDSYHSRSVLKALDDGPWKTRISEPKQKGFARWHGDGAARRAVTNNRTRLLSGVAKEAFKLRAEIVERSFAHNLDRGGMRRTWLRGRENVHKRYLLHVAGHNLSLLMRKLIGAGTPREAVAGEYAVFACLYQGAVIKTHRDRVRFSPGRKGAAGDAAHRLGFLTPSGDKRTRPVGRLAEALGRRSARLAMRCIAATGAPSREPRQAVSMGLYHCSLVLLRQLEPFWSLRWSSSSRRMAKPPSSRCVSPSSETRSIAPFSTGC